MLHMMQFCAFSLITDEHGSLKLNEIEKDLKTGKFKMVFGCIVRFLEVHKGLMRNDS